MQFTDEQSQAMYDFIRNHIDDELVFQARHMLTHTDKMQLRLTVTNRELVDMADLLATLQPAAKSAEGEGGGAIHESPLKLQNRNIEQFEIAEEYHNGDFYAYPVTYHDKEILNWHIYDKSAKDKNDYCIERNIRSRAIAIATVDTLAAARLNAQADTGRTGSGDAGDNGNGGNE